MILDIECVSFQSNNLNIEVKIILSFCGHGSQTFFYFIFFLKRDSRKYCQLPQNPISAVFNSKMLCKSLGWLLLKVKQGNVTESPGLCPHKLCHRKLIPAIGLLIIGLKPFLSIMLVVDKKEGTIFGHDNIVQKKQSVPAIYSMTRGRQQLLHCTPQ